MTRAVVVGSGMAGLTAAAYLARDGCDVDLFEQSDHIGGVTATLRLEEFAWDLGPLMLEGFGPGEPAGGCWPKSAAPTASRWCGWTAESPFPTTACSVQRALGALLAARAAEGHLPPGRAWAGPLLPWPSAPARLPTRSAGGAEGRREAAASAGQPIAQRALAVAQGER